MSLSERRKFLALSGAALALGGCNFTPAYAPGNAAQKLDRRIYIPEPTSEDLYQAVQQFEKRLGRAPESSAAMQLTFSVRKGGGGLGATATGSTTRYHWTGSLNFTLKDAASGSVLDAGSIRRFTAYSATGNIAATLAAERAATRRLMVILADALADRLLQLDPATLP